MASAGRVSPRSEEPVDTADVSVSEAGPRRGGSATAEAAGDSASVTVRGAGKHVDAESKPAELPPGTPAIGAGPAGSPNPLPDGEHKQPATPTGRQRCNKRCAAAKRRVTWAHWALLALFLVGVAGAVVASVMTRQQRHEKEMADALTDAVSMASRLSDALGGYERALTMMASAAEGLVLARGGLHAGVPFDPFAVVASKFLETLQGTSTGGVFLVRVPDAMRAEFEANATRDSAVALNRSTVVIHSGAPHIPIAAAEDYYPVTAAATTPVTAGPRKFLFFMDLVGGIPDGGVRRTAVETAMATGDVTATAPVTLVGNFGGIGYILYARVGSPTSGLDGAGAMGVVFTAVPSQQLVATLLGADSGVADALSPGYSTQLAPHERTLLLRVDDVTDEGAASQLVEYWSDAARHQELAARDTAWASVQLLESRIAFAGRTWLVRIAMRQIDIDTRVEDGSATLVLVAGLVCSLLVTTIIAMLIAAANRRLRLRVTQMRMAVSEETHSKLVAYLCHELRSPLHHLRAGLRFFLEDHAAAVTGDMSRELQMLALSVEQMNHVVNDILDMRKLEVGDIELHMKPSDVRAIVRDLTNQLRDAVGSYVSLRVVASKSLPDSVVTDPMRLRQLLGNAVHNAAKFTETGRIDIVVRTFQNDSWLLAEVRNTGVGLADKDVDALLGRFDEPAAPDFLLGGSSTSSRERRGLASPKSVRSAQSQQYTASGVQDEVTAWFAESVSTTPGSEINLPSPVAARFGQFVVSQSSAEGTAAHVDSLFSRTHGSSSVVSTAESSSESDTLAEGLSTLLNATGLGLGLPLCARIVERMGGAIGLGDVPGFTRWWVALPVGRAPVDVMPALDLTSPASRPAPHGTPARDRAPDVDGAAAAKGGKDNGADEAKAQLSDAHVVAIDDERVLRKIVGRFLTKMGVKTTLLDDGDMLERALADANAAGNPATCVLLDIVMKRSDGSQVCRALRAAGVTVPIYAMTGNVDAASVAKFKTVGFNGLLGKPFSYEDTVATVEHARKGAPEWLTTSFSTLPTSPLNRPRPRAVPRGTHTGSGASGRAELPPLAARPHSP